MPERTAPESPNQPSAFNNADFNKNLNQVSSVINDTISYLKGDNLATIYNTLQKTPDSKGFQSLVSRSSYSYSLNETQYSEFQTTTKEFGHNPFRSVGLINSQSNNGAMNGVGVQLGYKQFFGKNKFLGSVIMPFLITTMPISNPTFSTPLPMFSLMAQAVIFY